MKQIAFCIAIIALIVIGVGALSDHPVSEQTISKNGVTVVVSKVTTDQLLATQTQMVSQDRQRLQSDTTLAQEYREKRIAKIEERLEEFRASYEQSIYFRVTIGHDDPERDLLYEKLHVGYASYQEWLSTLLFEVPEHLELRAKDVSGIPPSLYHMERNYGMAKSRTFLVAFPKVFNDTPVDRQSMQFVIDEFGLGTGRLVFDFKSDRKA